MRLLQSKCYNQRIFARFSRVLILIAAVNLIFFSASAVARQEGNSNAGPVKGKITTTTGDPIAKVVVRVKGQPTITETTAEGEFTIAASQESVVLVFTKAGFETQELVYHGEENLEVSLTPEKLVNILWGSIAKNHVTDAVSYVSGDMLKGLPGINRNNLLGGRLTGLTVLQSNGEPGSESNALYIRGLRTLGGAKQSPYILVDGYWREDASSINPNDIESITLLKDAASTAMYGLRGGNGVVLITTKRGLEQDIKVSLDAKYGLQMPTRIPKYLDSYNYAYLYNEALRNGGGADKYDATALDAYKTGIDPFAYPNIDWGKEFLKDYSTQQDYNLSLRGGNKSLHYYASAGYVQNTGLFNVDKSVNTYNTNMDFNLFRLRSNVDVQITKDLSAAMEIGGRQEKRNFPGLMANSSKRIFSVLYQLPPNVFPVFNQDGSVAGNSQYTNNPYGLLNYSGYSIYNVRNTDAAFRLKYDLKRLIQGLSVRGSVSFDSYFQQTINRNKGFVVYEGSLANERGVKDPASQQNTNSIGDNQRIFDVQAGFDYARTFGLSDVTGTLFAEQTSFAGEGATVPHYYKGIMGRGNYVYNNRYLAQVSFAFQGSEQISDNHRYILFPAVSLGWILSEESFLKDNVSFINFLKVRASHGLTGNDSNIGYFQKLSFFERSGSYLFGDNLSSFSGYREGVLGNPDITAEKVRKSNLGLDASFMKNHLNFSGDVFYEKTTGIIVALNSIPSILGALEVPTGNAGIVENKGYEIHMDYSNNAGDFKYAIGGNFSYNRNKIIEMEEQEYLFEFNQLTGQPIGSQFGLQSLGFFYDDEEISSSPVQTYGVVRPGDLKYKDLTGDGKVDVNDVSYIGKSWMPEMVYGATLDMAYKGFDFNLLVEGIGNVSKKLSGAAYWEFYPNGLGKVMEHHLDRWAYYPELGVDTRATATYPRLSIEGDNTNNKAPNSAFWLKDASYLRIKSAEIGYTLPASISRYMHLSNVRIYATGYNLFTFDKIKVIDPESAGDGISYPIQRIYNFGVSVEF
jgi:TonB-linked SusC/RagA family outer membrane protein